LSQRGRPLHGRQVRRTCAGGRWVSTMRTKPLLLGIALEPSDVAGRR
jgi:hypothetical protein